MRLIFCIILLSASLLSQGQEFPFYWSSDTLNGELFEKTAIRIPIQIEGDSNTYYFQFDTGANHSSLYTYGADSSFAHRFTEKAINSSIGTIELDNNSNMPFSDEYGKVIGTIGSNWLKNKVIEIDFPHQKIKILQNYNVNEYHVSAIQSSYGRPVIQQEMDGKIYSYLYDTGASLFELWVTKKYWNKWRDKDSSISEIPIFSWGKTNIAYRSTLKQPVSIYNWPGCSINMVWYNSNKNFDKLFIGAGTDGVIGNVPFLDKVVLIDMENLKMGVKK